MPEVRKLPLEGIRVTSLCVVWGGPYVCMQLADWGAEVIRVESTKHFQPLTRGMELRPSVESFKNRAGISLHMKKSHDPLTAHNTYNNFNCHAHNKLSMTVDLTRPKGMEIFKKLIKVSDVFVENNAPRVKEKLGITWNDLRNVNPRLIMVSLSSFGDSGPYKNYRCLGAQVEGFCGHNYITGYPDEELDTVSASYISDMAAGASGALAVVMALHQRLKTGAGQYINISQAEAFIPYLAQAVMDFTMNGRVTERIGNRSYHGAVQGCYRCRDVQGKQSCGNDIKDSWVAITIANDQEWQGFCRAIGNPEWTRDDRFQDALSRLKNHDLLDRYIEKWTIGNNAYDVMYILQKHGVAAGPVMDEQDVYSDVHLRARGFFHELSHRFTGTHLYPGPAFQMSKARSKPASPPVCLGENNEYVYKQLLGISNEEYAELEKEGHIGTDYALEELE
jgi:crotonobetainyl-CoA:carnitine CoA-transferase CaiB-like acyl-CoA transferase